MDVGGRECQEQILEAKAERRPRVMQDAYKEVGGR